jgi:hypothetical protein
MKLPNVITSTLGRQVLLLKKNSPTLMFATGVGCAVTATVLACKATLKVEGVLAKHEEARYKMDRALALKTEEYTAKDYDKDTRSLRVHIARDFAKLYAPSFALGLVSLGLLTGAHITLTKRNAALGAAYAALDRGFREYRARVREELGEDKDREFFFGAVEKEVVDEGAYGHEVKTVKRVGKHSVYARPFDETNPCWSNSPLDNRAFLMAQQNYLNDLLQSRGHVMLNDAYDLFKMERSQAGTVVGWVKGSTVGDGMIDFGLFNSTDPVIRDFMNLEHNDGIMIDFNVDGVVNDLISNKY